VLDLIAFPSDSIGPIPPALDPARARYLQGIAHHGGQLVGLLDLHELIASMRAPG